MSDTEGKKSSSVSYEERVQAVNRISQPLASKKSTKKAHKLVKKASSAKIVRRGVKEVVKGIRKNEKGICILAGVSGNQIKLSPSLPIYLTAVAFIYYLIAIDISWRGGFNFGHDVLVY